MDPNKSFSRQVVPESADKEFPIQCNLTVKLQFSVEDMEKVKKWYANTRHELGDKFLADFDINRLIYEALAGGAVNPTVLDVLIEEVSHA